MCTQKTVHRDQCSQGKYRIVCGRIFTHVYTRMHMHTCVWVHTVELMFGSSLFKEALLFMRVCYCSLWSPHFITYIVLDAFLM